MPVFEIERDGRTFEVNAPDMQTAMQSLEMHDAQPQTASAPDKPWPYWAGLLGQAGNTMTGGLIDEAVAKVSAAAGRTPDGGVFEYDKPWDEREQLMLDETRKQQKHFQQEYPVASLGASLAGAGVLALSPLGRIGMAKTAPLSAANLGRAGAAGAGWGAAYGFGEGEGGFLNRMANVPVNLAVGAAGGVAGNFLQQGAGWLGRKLTSDNTLRAQQTGVSPQVYSRARAAAQSADADIPGGARQYIAKGGPNAMVGDAMPDLLDATANVGAGGPIARRNLGARVDQATRQTEQAIDETLGFKPAGVRQVARDISKSTSARRGDAYDAAYDAALDFNDGAAGNRVLNALEYIDPADFKTAKALADKKLRARYGPDTPKYRHWKANIDDAGNLAFENMPSVRELDMLKRALDEMAGVTDQWGRPAAGTQEIAIARNQLREALKEATTDAATGRSLYGEALDSGADKKAMDSALELGQDLLKSRTTVETAMEKAKDFGASERWRARQGVRSYLAEALGNVKRTRGDPNTDQRAAWKAISDILTDNNKEKMRAVLGDTDAKELFSELETAARAFGIRANAAPNSATAGRTAIREGVRADAMRGRLPDQPVRSIVDETLSLPIRGFNKVAGRSQAAASAREDAYWRELAELLTGKRGEEALRAFDMLISNARPNAGALPAGRYSQALARGTRLAAPPAVANLIQP